MSGERVDDVAQDVNDHRFINRCPSFDDFVHDVSDSQLCHVDEVTRYFAYVAFVQPKPLALQRHRVNHVIFIVCCRFKCTSIVLNENSLSEVASCCLAIATHVFVIVDDLTIFCPLTNR